MSTTDVDEFLRTAEEAKQARQYARAMNIVRSVRTGGGDAGGADNPELKIAEANYIGASVEYRMQLADALQVMPRDARVQELRNDLADAIALDPQNGNLPWDVAVIALRYCGDFEQASNWLDQALALGYQHPMVGAVQAAIENTTVPPGPDVNDPAYPLRMLFWRLIDMTSDGSLPESGPGAITEYFDTARTLVSSGNIPANALWDLNRRLRELRDQGMFTADPLDYGLELMYETAAASDDTDLAADTLGYYLRYLVEFSRHVRPTGQDIDLADMRKARRIAQRALKLVEDSRVAVDDNLHAEVLLALGQTYTHPADYRFVDAFSLYTQAYPLKVSAGNQDDAEWLAGLLRQMVQYCIENAMLGQASGIPVPGARSTGQSVENLQAGFDAARAIMDRDLIVHVAVALSNGLAAISQPEAGLEVVESALEEAELTADQQYALRFELASRLSELGKPRRAADVQSALLLDAESRRDRCVLNMNLANSLRELREFDRALCHYRDALDCLPERASDDQVPLLDGQLHANIGQLHLYSGDTQAALNELTHSESLIENVFGQPRIHLHELLARAYYASHDTRATLKHADRADAELKRLLAASEDPHEWESMSGRWSTLDGLGLAARLESDTPPLDALSHAEAAKGRMLSFLLRKHAEDPLPHREVVDRVAAWVSQGERTVVSLFGAHTGIATFGLTRDAPRCHWLRGAEYERLRRDIYEPWEELVAWSLEYPIQRALSNAGADPDLLIHAAKGMSELLLDRLGALLTQALPALEDGGGDLLIAPHRLFRSLPLANARLPSGKHLTDIFERVYIVPTLSDMLSLIEKPEPAAASILESFVDPDGSLPFARLESLATDAVGYVTSGRAATVEALERALLAPGALALSCHGDFEEGNPWHSTLTLADGEINLYDLIERIDVGRELLVLGACEAGKAQRSNSDEPIGFPTMFLQRGARRVIAPCVKVDDYATFLLMTRLYELLATNRDPARALHEATAWLRELTAPEASRHLMHLLDLVAAKQDGQPALDHAGKDIEGLTAYLERLEPDERPFSAPLFWAMFQCFGVPRHNHQERRQ